MSEIKAQVDQPKLMRGSRKTKKSRRLGGTADESDPKAAAVSEQDPVLAMPQRSRRRRMEGLDDGGGDEEWTGRRDE